jgi:3-oxoacyl-[acyl-carrier protein] reductase
MLLEGKKALVTGAGRGIGSAIAEKFAAEGATIALTYRNSRTGAEAVSERILAQGGKAILLQADLMDETQTHAMVQSALEALGGLDILVNNAAGFGPQKSVTDSKWADFDTEWQAVVKPVITTTQSVLPGMQAQRYGRIVNLSATLLQRPAIGYAAHAMAKSAVLAYTRTLAREVGPDGITVNAVSPGIALTEFSLSLPETEREAVRLRTPLRRLAEPNDVADAVLFFCSPLANFITGSNLAPDGGLAVL